MIPIAFLRVDQTTLASWPSWDYGSHQGLAVARSFVAPLSHLPSGLVGTFNSLHPLQGPGCVKSFHVEGKPFSLVSKITPFILVKLAEVRNVSYHSLGVGKGDLPNFGKMVSFNSLWNAGFDPTYVKDVHINFV